MSTAEAAVHLQALVGGEAGASDGLDVEPRVVQRGLGGHQAVDLGRVRGVGLRAT